MVDLLRSDRLELAVVFCSGYSDNKLLPMREDDVRTAFLAKPCTLNALVERVSRLCALSTRSVSGGPPSFRIDP